MIIPQSSSHVSSSSYLTMKWCYSIFFVVILFSGTFCSELFRKSLELCEPVYIVKLSVIIFVIYDFFVILNGFYPVSN